MVATLACGVELGARRLPSAVREIRVGLSHLGASVDEARRRVFGDYASAIEEIERRLPSTASYLLIGSSPDGTHFFVHYDLAPRRAPYLGLGVAADPEKCRALGEPRDAPPYAVVLRKPRYLPTLERTRDFFEGATVR